jgi:hypothetical protein
MYLNQYKIEGTINFDQNPCFENDISYPNFKIELENFKDFIKNLVEKKESKTFYKFGDGDYFFLKSEPVGSATPGKRALSKNYSEINMSNFVEGSKLNDYYMCEIYPENRKMFRELFPEKNIDFPAEYVYGLTANKWFFKNFSGKIGLIGADKKIEMIKTLMEYDEYKDYIGLNSFNDYIKIPQKFACDNLEKTEEIIAEQLLKSSSDIFLLGVGHVKSGITYRLKKYKSAVYLDIGSGIDAIAGIIDIERPFFGDWTNFQSRKINYNEIDYLAYQGKGKHKILN